MRLGCGADRRLSTEEMKAYADRYVYREREQEKNGLRTVRIIVDRISGTFRDERTKEYDDGGSYRLVYHGTCTKVSGKAEVLNL
jgi:hypothetical protein